MNVICLQNIEKSYGTRLLFTDVSITFTNQKRLGLVGINGTGKSTFLKIFPNSASVARLVEETGSPALIFTGMYVAASVLSIP